MSSLFVKIVNYILTPHSNADSLSLANPTGTSWQCVVKTEKFESGLLAVYIPVDSLLPFNLATALGLPNIKEGKNFRIRTIRLRGEVSQGLLVPLNDLIDLGLLTEKRNVLKAGSLGPAIAGTGLEFVDWKVDDDVAEALGITKYVEPEPDDISARREPPSFIKYSDIENIKNFPDVLLEGEETISTEKIHGSNFRAGWVSLPLNQTAEDNCMWHEGDAGMPPSHEFIVGTRRMALKSDESGGRNRWFRVAEKYDLINKMKPYQGYIIFGEVYGNGVQKMKYGEESVELRVFDVWNGTRYLDYDDFVEFADNINVPIAPVLYRGAYSNDILSYRNGKTVVGLGAHIREGIVIRPVKERWDRAVGRVILKSVSEDYLLGNYE